MERFVKISEFKFKRKELDQALVDALKVRNSILIHLVLGIGANPIKGGGPLLVYACEQNDLELVKKLIPTISQESEENRKYFKEAASQAIKNACCLQIIEEIFVAAPYTKEIAIKTAVDNNMIVMAACTLNYGATLHIDCKNIELHQTMIKELLESKMVKKIKIDYEALYKVISMDDASEVLELLLGILQKENPRDFDDLITNLAEECAEIGKVEYIKIIMKFGLDAKKVRTRYCRNKEMLELLKANGAYVCEY